MRIPDVRQTKFLLAAFILLVATALTVASFIVAWVTGRPPLMDGSLWWAIALSLFTAYSAADVTSTHLQQSKHIPAEEQTA